MGQLPELTEREKMMTKYETTMYYDALNASERLICIDSTNSTEEIKDKISERLNDTDNSSYNTFHIEIFHNELNAQSYTMSKASDDTRFDLWMQRTKQFNAPESIENIAEFIHSNLPKFIASPYDKYVAERLDKDKYLIKSFSDETYSLIIDATEKMTDEMPAYILGQFCYEDHIEYHPINKADTSELEQLLDNIHSDEIKLFARTCLRIIPDYVFNVPASNNSIERHASDIADEGLKRHIITTVKIMVYMTTPDYAHIKFTQHEIDMMITACLFHDFLKSGWQEDYEKDSSTKFNHARLAANALRCVQGIIPNNDLLFITNCIESHQGQWNTNPHDKTVTPLPIPDTEYKYMVHLADYLAVRNDIAFITDDTVYAFENQNIRTIKRFIPISDADRITISNALLETNIDMKKAESLNIHRNENEIRKLWKHITDTGRVTERQMKYVELARLTMFE